MRVCPVPYPRFTRSLVLPPPFICFLQPVQGMPGGEVTVCFIGACAALLSVKEMEIYLCMFL